MIDTHALGYGPLANRTVSSFPLSISTGLAIEALFSPQIAQYDSARIVPDHDDIKKYKHFWINIATLYRNCITALKRPDLVLVRPEEIKDALVFEMEVLRTLLAVEGNDVCKPVFYFCTYDSQYKKQKHNIIRLRDDTTDLMKHATSVMMKTMHLLFKEHSDLGLLKLDDSLPFKHDAETLMLSHMPWDLLSHHSAKRLTLLESHTGRLKRRHLWYTKYYPMSGVELNTLPFTRKLLLLFGDKVMFHPVDAKFRRMILDISVNKKWTPLTTDAKVLFDISNELKEPYLVDVFKMI